MGGVVARIVPGPGRPCWVCYAYALEDAAQGPGPQISVKPGDLHQPLGCAEPTFTGTGFDVAEFALASVRLAVGTLLGATSGGYPAPGWDAAIINLRDANGVVAGPSWSPLTVEVHPRCGRGSH